MDDWLASAARDRPAHPAVVAAEGTLSYGELDELARLTARRLAALGVEAGHRVSTTLAPGHDFAALLHALPRLGAALVPLNTRLPDTDQARQHRLAGASLRIDRPLENGFEAEPPPRAATGELDPAAVHTVLFTSGTSGEPKVVELTTGNQEASAAGSQEVFGYGEDDRWLCPLPLFHIGGLAILVRCARARATAVLTREIDLDGITLASVVATQLRRLRDGGLLRAPGLRSFVLGGGPVPDDVLDWARRREIPVRATYGMTETCSQVAVTDPWEHRARPVPGAHIEIGADDEILVSGPMVAPGALGEGGWLHTGDAGRINRDGSLTVEGRLKDVIITGGEKVPPTVVEAALLAHPSIADAGVAGVPDPEWGEAVAAFVVEARPVSDYELLAFARERLAGYQVPKRVVRVTELPRNSGGKLMRTRLRPPA